MENTLTAGLLDTNILVYANNKDSPFHQTSQQLVEHALNGNIKAVLAVQNLVELYAIITDKKRVERPLSCDTAKRLIEFYESHIVIIHQTQSTVRTLVKLIGIHKPSAQSIFDCFLAATMLDNNVHKIYTADAKHFEPFNFIDVVNPFTEKGIL